MPWKKVARYLTEHERLACMYLTRSTPHIPAETRPVAHHVQREGRLSWHKRLVEEEYRNEDSTDDEGRKDMSVVPGEANPSPSERDEG